MGTLNDSTKLRWRLILGRYSDDRLPLPLDSDWERRDEMLEFLYAREYGEDRGVRYGSLGPSKLTVPEWVTQIRELFPKQTVEHLEKHALENYRLTELVTDPEILRKLESNMSLLKSILQLKHLMKGPVLELARRLVDRIVAQLERELGKKVQSVFGGKTSRFESGFRPSLRDLDVKRTIRANLKYYDARKQKLFIEKLYFHRRTNIRHPWTIITLVDQSGSMIDSVIHSAVMASVFHKLPSIRQQLVLFDTQVVDVTGHVGDPVQTLLSVQLGGGTSIATALEYALAGMNEPTRTIVVLISDLYEGGSFARLFRKAKAIIESRATLIVLPSLDRDAVPVYDRKAAETLASLGAEVGILTPEELARWIRDRMSR